MTFILVGKTCFRWAMTSRSMACACCEVGFETKNSNWLCSAIVYQRRMDATQMSTSFVDDCVYFFFFASNLSFFDSQKRWMFWNLTSFGLADDVIVSIKRKIWMTAPQWNNRMNTSKMVSPSWSNLIFLLCFLLTNGTGISDLYGDDDEEEDFEDIEQIDRNRFKASFRVPS